MLSGKTKPVLVLKEAVHPSPPHSDLLSSHHSPALVFVGAFHVVTSRAGCAWTMEKPRKVGKWFMTRQWGPAAWPELGAGSVQCLKVRHQLKAGTHHADVGAVQKRATKSTPGGDSNGAPLGFRAQIHCWCPAACGTEGECAHVGYILQELPKKVPVNTFCLCCDLTHDIPQQPSRAKNAFLVCIWYS